MQAAIVPNLQTNAVLQSQNSSVQLDLTSAAPKTSFQDLIQKAQNAEESKPLEKTAGYAVEKKEVSSDEKQPLATEKTSDAEKSVEAEKTESKDVKIVKEKTQEKIASNSEKLVQKEVEKLEPALVISEEDAKNLKEKPQLNDSLTKISELMEKADKKLLKNEKSSENQQEIPLDFELSDVESIVTFLNKESIQIQEQFSQPEIVSDEDLINFELASETSVSEKTFNLDKDGKIKVHDFRSEEAVSLQDNDSKAEKSGLKVSEVKFDGKNSAEITLDVAANVQQNVISSSSQTAGSSSSNFQQMLTNQIQQNAADFVKAGNIVLKDNDVGSIKLILHPESLGNVKIDLQISDKNITGRIVVASQEAFNAFRDSADSLKQAFINSGFESAGLDLTFAGQNAESNQFAQQKENQNAQFTLNRAYGDLAEDAGFDYDENFVEISSRNSVNIVA